MGRPPTLFLRLRLFGELVIILCNLKQRKLGPLVTHLAREHVRLLSADFANIVRLT
jgi:hypothetical protein